MGTRANARVLPDVWHLFFFRQCVCLQRRRRLCQRGSSGTPQRRARLLGQRQRCGRGPASRRWVGALSRSMCHSSGIATIPIRGRCLRAGGARVACWWAAILPQWGRFHSRLPLHQQQRRLTNVQLQVRSGVRGVEPARGLPRARRAQTVLLVARHRVHLRENLI
jgi:hypothetical protein